MLAAVACGSEIDFANEFAQGKTDENSSERLIGKLEWAMGNPHTDGTRRFDKDCVFRQKFFDFEICNFFGLMCGPSDIATFRTQPVWTELRNGQFAALNQKFKDIYKPRDTEESNRTFPRPTDKACDVGVISAAAASGAIPAGEVVDVTFTISNECLLSQVSSALEHMSISSGLGTSGLPCYVIGTTDGDWDMAVRNFTRLAYLDNRNQRSSLLSAKAHKNLHEQLLSVDGPPAEPTYSLLGCGNTEQSTGSADERDDERTWLDDLMDDIGDWLEWLVVIIIVVFIALAAYAAYTFSGPITALLMAVGLAGAALYVSQINLPETENHLLMINTSKYLKNQLIIRDLGAGSEKAERWKEDQEDLEDWMFERMQGFLKEDFVEYNARPYQRLSLNALLNIADFAEKGQVREAARMVLDYSNAKFAVGSNQARRFLPLRRLRSELKKRIWTESKEATGLFDFLSGSDHSIALGLLYSGQNGQLKEGKASFGFANEAVYAATSPYRPEAFVVDMAIRKDIPIYQRIRHATAEIYSSGKGFLISAGGTTSPQAYSGSGFEFLDAVFASKVKDDRGAAVPTTLFLTSHNRPVAQPGEVGADAPPEIPDRTTMAELIRIDGERVDPDDEYPSFDYNLCVFDRFACGLNITVPDEFSDSNASPGCMTKGPQGSASEWDFIDTSKCAGYKFGPRVFIAVYRHACPEDHSRCGSNYGFFEVKDAEPDEDFEDFKKKVVTANSNMPSSVPHGPFGYDEFIFLYNPVGGGGPIMFDCDADDTDESGILKINGVPQDNVDDWTFAGGHPLAWRTGSSTVMAPITGSGDGLVEIADPRSDTKLRLDFRDVDAPTRTVQP